jgi:hypothetical protein
MRYLIVPALLLAALAQAGETLPDEARHADGEQDQQMQQRFPAPVMDAGELERLYLQSPVEIGESPAEGLRSVRGEDRYTDSDARNRERQRMEVPTVRPPSPASLEPSPMPTLPAGVPIRQL